MGASERAEEWRRAEERGALPIQRRAAHQRFRTNVCLDCLWISRQVWVDCPLSGRIPKYAIAHTMYAQAHTSIQKRKRSQFFGMYAVAHTPIPTKARQEMAPQGAQSARQGTQKARKRAPAVGCVGCVEPDSEWSLVGTCAHYTDASRNRRSRKGSEPERRLSGGPRGEFAETVAELQRGRPSPRPCQPAPQNPIPALCRGRSGRTA